MTDSREEELKQDYFKMQRILEIVTEMTDEEYEQLPENERKMMDEIFGKYAELIFKELLEESEKEQKTSELSSEKTPDSEKEISSEISN